MKKTLLSFFLICFLFLCVTSVSGVDWWDYDWNNCVAITIDCSYIDNHLKNVPVLISIDDSIGAICKTEGEDIRFTMDNVTLLNHEIEKWIADSDREIWVNVTSVASDSDTIIYMYYNNSDAEDGQNIEDVWDIDYKMVQHMGDSTWQTTLDSTTYDNDAVGEDQTVTYLQTGKIGYSTYVSTGWVDFGNSATLQSPYITVEAWGLTNEQVSTNNLLQMPYDEGAVWDAPYVAYGVYTSGVTMGSHVNVDGTYKGVGSARTMGTGVWYYQVMTYDGTTQTVYRDGAVIGTDSTSGSITYSGDPKLAFGVRSVHSVGEYWIGRGDEFRISDIARNLTWINFSFNSGNQTDGFLTWGSIQEKPLPVNIPDILYMFPVNNTDDLCPCYQIFGVNVSDIDGDDITIFIKSNSTGSWKTFLSFPDVENGSYYGIGYNFTKFDFTYWWNVEAKDKDGTNTSAVFTLNTTSDITCGIGGTTDDVIGYALVLGLCGGILGGIILQRKKQG